MTTRDTLERLDAEMVLFIACGVKAEANYDYEMAAFFYRRARISSEAAATLRAESDQISGGKR